MTKKEKQTMDCKEKECPEFVDFEYTPIEASDRLASARTREYEVSLTCKNGHTHTYSVLVAK